MRTPDPSRTLASTPRGLVLGSVTACAVWAACSACAACAACGKQPLDAPRSPASPPPLEVVVGDPVTAPPVVVVVAPPVAVAREHAPSPARPAAAPPESVVEPEALPKAWVAPSVPGLSFADALRKARAARDAFGRLVPPASGATGPSSASGASGAGVASTTKAWFGQAQAFTDLASRMYAASFHAPDASREGRIDAIAEAAELDMTMARALDEAGLGSLPVAWRADPAVMSTFEDIAMGPTRRWRAEARVLARQCIDTARETGVATDAARRCKALRTGTPTTARRAPDVPAGCACSPGDPLCSASLGGWCAPTP